MIAESFGGKWNLVLVDNRVSISVSPNLYSELNNLKRISRIPKNRNMESLLLRLVKLIKQKSVNNGWPLD